MRCCALPAAAAELPDGVAERGVHACARRSKGVAREQGRRQDVGSPKSVRVTCACMQRRHSAPQAQQTAHRCSSCAPSVPCALRTAAAEQAAGEAGTRANGSVSGGCATGAGHNGRHELLRRTGSGADGGGGFTQPSEMPAVARSSRRCARDERQTRKTGFAEHDRASAPRPRTRSAFGVSGAGSGAAIAQPAWVRAPAPWQPGSAHA